MNALGAPPMTSKEEGDLCPLAPVHYCRFSQRAPAQSFADVAQLVAHHLAKVRVAGSNPVIRSGTS